LRPAVEEPKPPRRKEKETGRGGVALDRRRPRLKRAWQGSTRIAKRQRGRAVIGLAKAAARIMEGFNRAMQNAFAPHLSPLQLALERSRQEQDAAARQAQAQTAELAEQQRQFDEWRDEQRRQMQADAGAQGAGDAAIRAAAAAHEPATQVSDSLDYFWQQHWQNEIEASSSAEIPDTEPSRDFSADYDGGARPSLHL
jgi:hypothetical protein